HPEDSADDQDTVHFHRHALGQGGHADGGAGRVGLLEVTTHDLVDLGEVVQVGQEDVQLDDVLQLAAGGFGHQCQVVEYPADLGFEALDHFHGLRVQRDLSGQIHGIADLDRLGVGADRGGSVFAGDDLLVHECLHWFSSSSG